jgi:gamma-glutamyl:cysteine ligase YbdK (ATP-grasp superfamily)
MSAEDDADFSIDARQCSASSPFIDGQPSRHDPTRHGLWSARPTVGTAR